jgi:hypothetical protein
MGRRPQVPKNLSPIGEPAAKNPPDSSVVRVVRVTTQDDGKADPMRSPAIVQEPVTTGHEDSVIPRSRADSPLTGRSTAFLLREACRSEALKFMPAVSILLNSPKTNASLKLRCLELLLQYGVGQKFPEGKPSGISIQSAVIALQPRVEASKLLPIANPSQTVFEAPSGLSGQLRTIPDGFAK